MSIGVAAASAITAELATAAIRFYFLYRRMGLLAGMTPEELDAKYAAISKEFEARPPSELMKLVEEFEKGGR